MGGVVKEYQIVVDPMKLTQYGISLGEVKSALDASNQEAGGSSRRTGGSRIYGARQRLPADARRLQKYRAENRGITACRFISATSARVQIGPEMRRGIAELNGLAKAKWPAAW